MRDPAGIDLFLDRIRDLWKQHPDLRLGQLIFLLAGDRDLWNIEGEELVAGIRGIEPSPAQRLSSGARESPVGTGTE